MWAFSEGICEKPFLSYSVNRGKTDLRPLYNCLEACHAMQVSN